MVVSASEPNELINYCTTAGVEDSTKQMECDTDLKGKTGRNVCGEIVTRVEELKAQGELMKGLTDSVNFMSFLKAEAMFFLFRQL